MRLGAELQSHLSIKRSAKLLLGNIKRRVRPRTRAKNLLISVKPMLNKIRWLPKEITIGRKINRISRGQLENGDKIPKVIHYIWIGGSKKPEAVEKYIKTWKRHCPDYKIIEWNEKNYNYKKNRYAREAYDAKKWAFVTDFMRLDILDRFGGVYLDSDVEMLKNIDGFLKESAFTSFEAGDPSQILLPTGLLAAEKGNEWIKYLKSYYGNNRSLYLPSGEIDHKPNTEIITKMTTEKYNIKLDDKMQKNKDFTLYPHDYFCPKSWATRKVNLTSNSHAIHHFSGSWLSAKACKLQHRNEKR
jgi:mannosyltransferase OCH1-like enzyme